LFKKRYRKNVIHFKSKETYGQTRGLGNLEMKRIGELASTGVLLKQAGFVPCKVALNPGGLLWEFLGWGAPLGPWNP